MKDFVNASKKTASTRVNFWNTRGGYIVSVICFGIFVYVAGYVGIGY